MSGGKETDEERRNRLWAESVTQEQIDAHDREFDRQQAEKQKEQEK